MIKYCLSLFIVLSITACSTSKVDIPEVEVASNKKAFEQEDMYIMFALRAEEIRDYRSASELFNTLYENSNRDEYIYRSIQNSLAAKEFDKVIAKIDNLQAKGNSDFYLVRVKIVALVGLFKYEEAKVLALDLVKKSQNINDYLLVSDIYVQLKDYETAMKYLESAYVKNYNEKILDKMAIILYVNLHREKDAIAQLETHIRVHGCSKTICVRLIGFYSNENNVDGLLYVYLKLYQFDKNRELSDKIVQIYAYKKDYVAMMSFLESSKSDDKALLQLYISASQYQKASTLAQRIYADTNDINYLGQSAIYEYEASTNKNDKEMLNAVVIKLKSVVEGETNPLFLNYLGYILIDHEIDINMGLEYVENALALEPNSAFYLDSLAWGYYKLGECVKAKELIDRVVKLEGGDDEEVTAHVKLIDECLNK